MLILLFFVVTAGYFILKSQTDKDGRIPPFSTPEGKRARLIAAAVAIACLVVITLNGGGEWAAQLAAVMIVLIVVMFLVQRRDKKRGKKIDDYQALKSFAIVGAAASLGSLLYWPLVMMGFILSIQALALAKGHASKSFKKYRIIAIVGLTISIAVFLLVVVAAIKINSTGG